VFARAYRNCIESGGAVGQTHSLSSLRLIFTGTARNAIARPIATHRVDNLAGRTALALRLAALILVAANVTLCACQGGIRIAVLVNVRRTATVALLAGYRARVDESLARVLGLAPRGTRDARFFARSGLVFAGVASITRYLPCWSLGLAGCTGHAPGKRWVLLVNVQPEGAARVARVAAHCTLTDERASAVLGLAAKCALVARCLTDVQAAEYLIRIG
jgi:hypothetical protein